MTRTNCFVYRATFCPSFLGWRCAACSISCSCRTEWTSCVCALIGDYPQLRATSLFTSALVQHLSSCVFWPGWRGLWAHLKDSCYLDGYWVFISSRAVLLNLRSYSWVYLRSRLPRRPYLWLQKPSQSQTKPSHARSYTLSVGSRSGLTRRLFVVSADPAHHFHAPQHQ